MTLFAIIGFAIGLCFGLQWIALPIAIFMRRGLTRRWLWGLGVLALPFVYVAAFQSGYLRSPSWRSWVARVAIAAAVVFGIIQLGGSSWANSSAVFELKGTLASLFTSEIASVEGRIIRTLDGNTVQSSESAHAFPAAFAVASFAIVAGAMQFYGPIIKSISLALLFFGCSFVTTLITQAWLIDALSTDQPYEVLAALHDCQTFYNFHLWYLVTFCAAVFWAWYDIRRELPTPEVSCNQEEAEGGVHSSAPIAE